MAINHKKKLIFIHIPKTAGTSIYKSLGVEDISYQNKFLGHRSIENYKEQYKDYWNIYLKFTVVRDPIDRFISAYKFARMRESFWHSDNSNKLPKNEYYEICNSLDINQYILDLYNTPENHTILTLPQIFFIENKYKKIEVDYIAKYENLDNDLKNIGVNLTERLNVSTINNINSIQLTKKSKKILYEMYEIDYNFFYNENSKNEKTFSYS
jgi:hypothetical protein